MGMCKAFAGKFYGGFVCWITRLHRSINGVGSHETINPAIFEEPARPSPGEPPKFLDHQDRENAEKQGAARSGTVTHFLP